MTSLAAGVDAALEVGLKSVTMAEKIRTGTKRGEVCNTMWDSINSTHAYTLKQSIGDGV